MALLTSCAQVEKAELQQGEALHFVIAYDLQKEFRAETNKLGIKIAGYIRELLENLVDKNLSNF